jgi:hypothetical protein
MSGLLVIQAVDGTGPSYTLTVQASAGVVSGNHVVAPKFADNTHGGVYRVTSVPDGVTVIVTDDLVPGGGTYGKPTFGRSAYWSPVTGTLSASKANGTPFWGDVTERDLQLLAGGLDTSDKHGILIPFNFTGNPKKATVTFVTPFGTTDYAITISALTDGSKSYGAAPENKTVNGFDINLHSNNLAGLVEVGWQASISGE